MQTSHAARKVKSLLHNVKDRFHRSNDRQNLFYGVARPLGGARRDRTDDLLLAKQALSQLSYGPVREQTSDVSRQDVLITDF